ncbi:MAG: phosphatidate cytidylyltransferase [Gloeobacteraceae cyanobacterium ES-bin-144]|nr:phosphatidate cytidylyltransferase [Verrucomicrobiales bacterium]
MSLDPELVYLVGTVIFMLALSGLITRILIFRNHGESSPTLENLRNRVTAWWWMVGVFSVSLAIGKNGVFALYLLLSFLALREYITLSPLSRGDHRTLSWVFFIILPLHYLFAWAPWYGMFIIFIPVYGFIFIPIRSVLAGEVDRFLERTSRIQWGVLTCVYFLSHLPMILYLPIPGYEGQNAKLLFFVVLVTQSSDVFQYIFGKTLGRRKIAPTVSPGKTWEGLIGGGLAAVALGTGLWWATPFSPLAAAMMSLVLVIAGFLGGLVMSAIKRSIGAKDWGRGIPGHGGVLDRMDSLLFAAPIFFHLTGYYFGTHLAVSLSQPEWLRGILKFWL